MTRWCKAWAIGLSLGGVAIGTLVEVAGQEPAPATPPAAATTSKAPSASPRRKNDAARRVPTHFGQIGLTTEQRANIYAIQGRRLEAIEALEQQISREKAEMLAQCEGTLTETQRKLLDNLRRAANEAGMNHTADATPPH